MRLFFDKRLNYFVAAPGQSAAATGAVVKSGDTERVEILVGRSSDPAGAPGLFEAQEWTNEAFPTGTNIAIVAKAPGKYSDGLPLALADDFTLSGNTYTFELDLNTDEINDELNRGDDEEENDIASITAGFEMSYQLGGSGGWQSSALPFALTINHDLYSGVEGNPNSASSPDAYLLRSNGVRHFKDLDALVGGDPTDLDSIPTVSAPLGELYSLVDESGTDPVYRVYRLEAGTDATDAPDVVRPDDYATTTNEKVFRLVLAESLASLSNPMTAAGDIIKGGTSGVPERLAIGTTGQVLTVVAGAPGWATPAAGGIPSEVIYVEDTTLNLNQSHVGKIFAVHGDASSAAVQIRTQAQSSSDGHPWQDNAYFWVFGEGGANDERVLEPSTSTLFNNGSAGNITLTGGKVYLIYRQISGVWRVIAAS